MRNHTPISDAVQAILSRLECVKAVGEGKWLARCPAHDDDNPSLSVSQGKDGRALVYCHAGCDTAEILRQIGLEPSAVFVLPKKGTTTNLADARRIVGYYDYRSADGRLLFQVVRYEPKGFRQRRPGGNGGWIWNLKAVPRVLYHLPELLAADPSAWVFIVEGEKDVENLRKIGLVATTNPGGKGKWKHLADDSALDGRRVAIIPDRDRAGGGMEHAQDVAARLHGKAAEARIVELPGDFKDVSDWLDVLDCRTPE
ncbi:unnamed protein product, partial [marine sediment metagenome]